MSLPEAAAHSTVAYRDIISDDGTVLRAWTNDPDRVIDGPTVLLCNGLGTNPWAWPALLHTDCGVRVVSWMHRGTAGSDLPADPWKVGVTEFVEDALSVMDHFGLERPVVMGWSIGVNTMFELAAEHPERVAGLFAVAGVPGDTFSTMLGPLRLPRPVARALTVSASHALRLTGRVLTPLTSHLTVRPGMIEALRHTGLVARVADPELAALALTEFLRTPVEWYFHLALRSAEHRRVSLRRIKVPVTFVAGSYDVLAGARHMATAAAAVPDGTFIEVRGSHFLCLEQPELIHRLLLDFLPRVQDGRTSPR
ncbi:MAG: alpha/beta hydrolase [Nocardioides sp.]|uniref:alpha/beta fold hydrolase n=1 Tax=Nocardioides sp. TaxID=35761 RepID=UPI0039E373C8